jgi:hypothetical protein
VHIDNTTLAAFDTMFVPMCVVYMARQDAWASEILNVAGTQISNVKKMQVVNLPNDMRDFVYGL